MKLLFTFPLALLLVTVSLHAECIPGHNAASRIVCNATEDLDQLFNASDRGVPLDLLNKASCVIVVPDLKKGGFIVGGEYGRGLFSCRKPDGIGWSAPGFIKVMGGKFGLLIGGAEADVLMLVMNQDGMRHLLRNKVQLGGEVSAAAGPVGRNVSAMTDAELHAEILTYSRQRGIFGGLDLSGSAILEDSDLIYEAYGQKRTNKEVITGEVQTPEVGQPFMKTLTRFSSRK
ncbi:MAG TPA: lipid-binding SYLF domain-containing protein [Bryobacteraceae bacterium]|jgi:lipid-binding SYLF domain-containing protein|nr:lipid-binding SYLF domain-containing protein [Bryobacteraceae bacterium]